MLRPAASKLTLPTATELLVQPGGLAGARDHAAPWMMPAVWRHPERTRLTPWRRLTR